MDHSNFWWDFVGRIGAPVFAATLVACLLVGEFNLSHAILMATGLGMMGISHWQEQHRDGGH